MNNRDVVTQSIDKQLFESCFAPENRVSVETFAAAVADRVEAFFQDATLTEINLCVSVNKDTAKEIGVKGNARTKKKFFLLKGTLAIKDGGSVLDGAIKFEEVSEPNRAGTRLKLIEKIRRAKKLNENEDLVGRLFGAQLVNEVENAIRSARERMKTPESIENKARIVRYVTRNTKQVFLALNDAQTEAVDQLLRETAYSVLQGILTRLERFDNFDVRITASPADMEEGEEDDLVDDDFGDEDEGSRLLLAGPGLDPLEDRFYDWIEQFGEEQTLVGYLEKEKYFRAR